MSYDKIVLSFSLLLIFINCDGQIKNKKCSIINAIDVINNLPETQRQSKFVDSIKKNKQHLSFMTDSFDINHKQYYRIKTGLNGEFHWETYTIFYVDKISCDEVLVEDVISGDIVTLKEWRNQNNPKNNSLKTIEFTDLFNEGTTINFTPKDLDKKDPKIQEFKKNLKLFEEKNPLSKDFDYNNLIYLINNETFFDLQYFINSSWLNYFIEKYKIDGTTLHNLMKEAIENEDFNAVNILINKNYIVSAKDLEIIKGRKEWIKETIKEDKKEGVDSYLVSKSKIDEISTLLNSKYKSNIIQDTDGFTNLRKDKNAQSQILQKIKSGDYIEVLDNSGDWFLIKTKEGEKGYVHKSRIKSK